MNKIIWHENKYFHVLSVLIQIIINLSKNLWNSPEMHTMKHTKKCDLWNVIFTQKSWYVYYIKLA